MKHVYIHIPFCRQKCNYCDFVSKVPVPNKNNIEKVPVPTQYIDRLCQEINQYLTQLQCNESGVKQKCTDVTTLYIGGGTPSLLTPDQLAQILSNFTFASDYELTIEANPDSITKEKLIAYKNLGVNRLSIGVQSFDDRCLKFLGRIHDRDGALNAIQLAATVFENINIDLMTTIPGQTITDVERDLAIAIKLKPKHLSVYELTYEPGTQLYKDKQEKSQEVEIYEFTRKYLKAQGYEQYEISNYALPGRECRHNLAYWSDVSYVGFGLAAHSYDRDQQLRWANTADLEKYLIGEWREFTEPAKPSDVLLMGLRKNSGVEESLFRGKEKVLEKFLNLKYLERVGEQISFTDQGRLLANQVLVDLV